MYCSKWNRDRSERSQGKTWRCGDQLFRFLDHNFGEYWQSIFKAVYSRSMFWHYRYSKCHISGNNVNVHCIEVSLFCPGCALFEYVIKREYVSSDKWLNLTCAVTYNTFRLFGQINHLIAYPTHDRWCSLSVSDDIEDIRPEALRSVHRSSTTTEAETTAAAPRRQSDGEFN